MEVLPRSTHPRVSVSLLFTSSGEYDAALLNSLCRMTSVKNQSDPMIARIAELSANATLSGGASRSLNAWIIE